MSGPLHRLSSWGLGLALLVGLPVAAGAAPRSPAPAAASSSPCGTLSVPPAIKHVVWVYEENHSYSSIIGSSQAPYINGLAASCGLATNYHNITHASLPNYIGITSGLSVSALAPFWHDCTPSSTCETAAPSIFGQTSSWRAYEESMASNCLKTGNAFYVLRHNPPVYYTTPINCPSNDLPLGTTSSSALINAFGQESTAPAVATVTPNICDDMHGSTASGCTTNLIANGDAWLKTWLGLLTATPVYASGDTAIFVLWDEGEGGSKTAGEVCYDNTSDVSCHVALLVVAPSVVSGARDGALTSHYSVLKTTEDLLGLPELGMAGSAASLVSAFNL